jgi:hypothetical protein
VDDICDRIEAILRGEYSNVQIDVTPIPPWYGSTASSACDKWLDMWIRMKASQPHNEWFYLSNAIGWASR